MEGSLGDDNNENLLVREKVVIWAGICPQANPKEALTLISVIDVRWLMLILFP